MDYWLALAKKLYESLIDQAVTPAGGVGGHIWIEPGNAVEVEQMDNAQKLRELCQQAVDNPDWVAHDTSGDGIPETFCNMSVRFICMGMGYAGFGPELLANDMLDQMAGDPDFEEVPLSKVESLALRGALVILGAHAYPHGHVTPAAPEPAQESTSWGGKVPMVAHVGGGKTVNGIMRVSGAYSLAKKPGLRAYLLTRSLA